MITTKSNTKSTRMSDYLSERIDRISSEKSQRDIANEVGYDRGNIISMMKTGETKVPLDKIPLLAKAVNGDPVFMLRLWLEQYWTNQAEIVNTVFDCIATQEEMKLLKGVRLSLGEHFVMTPARVKAAIDALDATKG
jgi:hypothetical protein